MKTMTCKQLGGACDKQFTAETFEEMAEMSKNHGMEMFREKDEAHLQAMEAMKKMTPEEFQQWYADRKKEFEEE